MQKRGQIYLLVALVMSVIIFGMVTVSNKVGQESMESDFEDLSQNYAVESSKLINSMLGKGEVIGPFRNFTLLFTSYSKTQNPKYELIYALNYNDMLYIGNYLKSRIFLCTDPVCSAKYPPLEGCYSKIPASVGFDSLNLPVELYHGEIAGQCETSIPSAGVNAVYMTINGITYHFSTTNGRQELIIVSWEAKEEQRKVYTEGNFVEGTIGAGPKMTLERYCREMQQCDTAYCDCENRKVLCPMIDNEEECSANSLDCKWNKQMEMCVEA